MDRNPDLRIVSFVVPAWNEERWLPGALAAIRDAASALALEHEIVVADDGSTDRTAELARAAGATVVPVLHRQIAATRNAGARASRGQVLLFVDADTIVHPGVVRAALAAVDRGAVGGGCGFRFDGDVPLWTRPMLRFMVFAFRRARLAAGCFFFARRIDFEAVGGFDETLYAGEELALARELKRRGPFVVLREQVETSARKLRSYGGARHFRDFLRLAWKGEKALRNRDLLDLWYRDARHDPQGPARPAHRDS